MDVLTHFRSIEELTKTLSREQGLLSEMFEKRKLMKFPVGLAIDLVGGNEARLRKLIDYGVLVEAGNALEIESDYLNFFETGRVYREYSFNTNALECFSYCNCFANA